MPDATKAATAEFPPQLSFDCTAAAGGALLPRRLVHDAAGNAFLPWCGLLVNTATLEMQVCLFSSVELQDQSFAAPDVTSSKARPKCTTLLHASRLCNRYVMAVSNRNGRSTVRLVHA